MSNILLRKNYFIFTMVRTWLPVGVTSKHLQFYFQFEEYSWKIKLHVALLSSLLIPFPFRYPLATLLYHSIKDYYFHPSCRQIANRCLIRLANFRPPPPHSYVGHPRTLHFTCEVRVVSKKAEVSNSFCQLSNSYSIFIVLDE